MIDWKLSNYQVNQRNLVNINTMDWMNSVLCAIELDRLEN